MHAAQATVPEARRRPVGRLAPSPTGRLHLGHARSFLLAWWHARSRGASIVLRMEDLDATRVRADSVATTLADLEWLGLDWDGEMLLQSADTRPMAEACAQLLAAGRAYPCVCTRGEIRALSAPHAGEEEPRYPGTCRGRFATMDEARAATGREPALRLVVPEGPTTFDDGLAGRATFDVQRDIGDFVLSRRDGAFAYQLAVVVDDARQGVDEIVRGADLLPSTARQRHLQALLALPYPRTWHVPLVLDESGERLAKRRDSESLSSLRELGVDPRAVVAWAAKTAGLEVGERLCPADLLGAFDLSRIPREPVRLASSDLETLRAARP